MEQKVDSTLYWRSVKEELPTCEKLNANRSWRVWACVKAVYNSQLGIKFSYRCTEEAEYSADGKWYKPMSKEQLQVTHWMPMPTLPSEEGGEE